MIKVMIERVGDNKLTGWQWAFELYTDYRMNGASILLTSYRTVWRPSPRHQWRHMRGWTDRQTSPSDMAPHEVTIPPDVLREAFEQVTQQLHIVMRLPTPPNEETKFRVFF